MRILQTYSILSVVFAICFAMTAPLIYAYDTHETIGLEMLETEEESQSEQEENQEELADDDFKDDFIYGLCLSDPKMDGLFLRQNQLLDLTFSDPSSPPPELL